MDFLEIFFHLINSFLKIFGDKEFFKRFKKRKAKKKKKIQ